MFGQKIIDMRFDVVTLFPDLIKDALDHGITGRAMKENQLTLKTWNPRDFTDSKTGRVDDKPYGGGAGMVLMPEPVFKAVEEVNPQRPLILLGPSGRKFDQRLANELSDLEGFSLLCGRYEGVDERIRTDLCDDEISIGDFVLAGGELAALTVIETVARRRKMAKLGEQVTLPRTGVQLANVVFILLKTSRRWSFRPLGLFKHIFHKPSSYETYVAYKEPNDYKS